MTAGSPTRDRVWSHQIGMALGSQARGRGLSRRVAGPDHAPTRARSPSRPLTPPLPLTGSLLTGPALTGSLLTGPVLTGSLLTGPVLTGPVLICLMPIAARAGCAGASAAPPSGGTPTRRPGRPSIGPPRSPPRLPLPPRWLLAGVATTVRQRPSPAPAGVGWAVDDRALGRMRVSRPRRR
jgi:hypothetical protein